jgi:iron complex outermembrane receptor protein
MAGLGETSMKFTLFAFTSLMALSTAAAVSAETVSTNTSEDQAVSATQQDPSTSAVGSDDSAPQSTRRAGGEETEVQQVVVTARKREELLRDIPIAATVVDQAAITDQGGIRTMEDLLANAPAVHFLSTTSPVNSEVTIRGSGTSRGTNAEAAVGLYRNGAYVGGGTLGGRSFSRWDLFDIERAEVLRGTQGALYGRNAVGGAINVLSQRPIFEQEAELFVQYATNDYKQVDFIYNAPISENLAFRISMSGVDQQEGFFYNPTRGEYFDAQETSGIRGQVRYRAGRFDGTLLAEHYQGNLQSVTFQVIIPAGTNPTSRRVSRTSSTSRATARRSAKQQLNSIQATSTTTWASPS